MASRTLLCVLISLRMSIQPTMPLIRQISYVVEITRPLGYTLGTRSFATVAVPDPVATFGGRHRHWVPSSCRFDSVSTPHRSDRGGPRQHTRNTLVANVPRIHLEPSPRRPETLVMVTRNVMAAQEVEQCLS